MSVYCHIKTEGNFDRGARIGLGSLLSCVPRVLLNPGHCTGMAHRTIDWCRRHAERLQWHNCVVHICGRRAIPPGVLLLWHTLHRNCGLLWGAGAVILGLFLSWRSHGWRRCVADLRRRRACWGLVGVVLLVVWRWDRLVRVLGRRAPLGRRVVWRRALVVGTVVDDVVVS